MPRIAKPLPSVEYLYECFLYNPETGELTWKERPASHFPRGERDRTVWNIRFANRVIKTRTNVGYIHVGINRGSYLAHRIIWKMQTGEDPNEIDHIDHNRSNNKWINLREADPQKNNANHKLHKHSKSGIKGIHKNGKRWAARITVNKQEIYLGIFKTREEAKAAYDKAAQEAFGEFWCPG